MFTEKPSYSLEWELVTDPGRLVDLCVDLDNFAIIDLSTDNHDVVAELPTTGDEDYDTLVTHANGVLLAASSRLYHAAKETLGRLIDDGLYGPEDPDSSEYLAYPCDKDGRRWYPEHFALLEAVQRVDPAWPKYSRGK